MWLTPTRQRPANLQRLFAAWAAAGGSTPGVVWVDDDDEENYAGIELPRGWVKIVYRRMGGLGDIMNEFFRLYPAEPWYGMVADDVVPITPYFDKALIAAAGLDGVAYGDDGICQNGCASDGKPLATHPVIGGDFARVLGFLALPGTQRVYMDTALSEAANRKGVLRYLPQVKMEHWHFSNGKAPYDETYRKTCVAADKEIYEKWLKTL